jgi:hypothetical protein
VLSLLGAVPAGSAPPPTSPAEPLRFSRLSTEDGLSDTHVWSIVQDRQGFMWFGTDLGA